jgi:adenylate kinase family enzyme
MRVLEEHLAVETFVTGDWCRDHQAEIAKSGTLAPDELCSYVSHLMKHGESPFCFFVDAPRTLEQAQFFCAEFQTSGATGLSDIITIHIDAEPETCQKRIIDRATRQNRDDDKKAATIRKRLGYYFGIEKPGGTDDFYEYQGVGGVQNAVAPWLKEHTHYYRIDGDLDLEDIRDKVRLCLIPEVFGE